MTILCPWEQECLFKKGIAQESVSPGQLHGRFESSKKNRVRFADDITANMSSPDANDLLFWGSVNHWWKPMSESGHTLAVHMHVKGLNDFFNV